MRDDDQRTVEVGQEALEPLEALAVEVVRRLVEQQHLGVAEQRRGQQRPGLLASGQALERRVARQVLDGQAPAGLLGPGLRGPAAGRLDALERVRVGLERVGAGRARAARRRSASHAGPIASRSRSSSVPAGASCGR